VCLSDNRCAFRRSTECGAMIAGDTPHYSPGPPAPWSWSLEEAERFEHRRKANLTEHNVVATKYSQHQHIFEKRFYLLRVSERASLQFYFRAVLRRAS